MEVTFPYSNYCSQFHKLKDGFTLKIFAFFKYHLGQVVENPPANAGNASLILGLGRSPGERSGNLIPLYWPGESHGQRSMVGYSPWVAKSRT